MKQKVTKYLSFIVILLILVNMLPLHDEPPVFGMDKSTGTSKAFLSAAVMDTGASYIKQESGREYVKAIFSKFHTEIYHSYLQLSATAAGVQSVEVLEDRRDKLRFLITQYFHGSRYKNEFTFC